MIEAIIFDCFGVVISDALSVIVADLHERDPAGAEEIRNLVSLSNRGIIDAQDSSQQVAAILGTNYEGYRKMIADGEVKDYKLLEYIQTLRPQYKTAMLSNIGLGGLLRRFPDHELRNYFDQVVASSEIGHAKPDPEAYVITAERLGVDPTKCIFIDDRQEYCDGAHQVGMQAFVYRNLQQMKAELTEVLNGT